VKYYNSPRIPDRQGSSNKVLSDKRRHAWGIIEPILSCYDRLSGGIFMAEQGRLLWYSCVAAIIGLLMKYEWGFTDTRLQGMTKGIKKEV
jgi:hypothetical protein